MVATVLKADTAYVAGDRFVCSMCCGVAARVSGTDLDGHKLRPVDQRDVKEWAGYGLGPLTCECGLVTVEAK